VLLQSSPVYSNIDYGLPVLTLFAQAKNFACPLLDLLPYWTDHLVLTLPEKTSKDPLFAFPVFKLCFWVQVPVILTD